MGIAFLLSDVQIWQDNDNLYSTVFWLEVWETYQSVVKLSPQILNQLLNSKSSHVGESKEVIILNKEI